MSFIFQSKSGSVEADTSSILPIWDHSNGLPKYELTTYLLPRQKLAKIRSSIPHITHYCYRSRSSHHNSTTGKMEPQFDGVKIRYNEDTGFYFTEDLSGTMEDEDEDESSEGQIEELIAELTRREIILSWASEKIRIQRRSHKSGPRRCSDLELKINVAEMMCLPTDLSQVWHSAPREVVDFLGLHHQLTEEIQTWIATLSSDRNTELTGDTSNEVNTANLSDGKNTVDLATISEPAFFVSLWNFLLIRRMLIRTLLVGHESFLKSIEEEPASEDENDDEAEGLGLPIPNQSFKSSNKSVSVSASSQAQSYRSGSEYKGSWAERLSERKAEEFIGSMTLTNPKDIRTTIPKGVLYFDFSQLI